MLLFQPDLDTVVVQRAVGEAHIKVTGSLPIPAMVALLRDALLAVEGPMMRETEELQPINAAGDAPGRGEG